jgi:hypothetical protein
MSTRRMADGLDWTICPFCGLTLELEILHSHTGYYLGFSCPSCGPHSRKTDFYESRREAEEDLIWYQRNGSLPGKLNFPGPDQPDFLDLLFSEPQNGPDKDKNPEE